METFETNMKSCVINSLDLWGLKQAKHKWWLFGAEQPKPAKEMNVLDIGGPQETQGPL